MGLGLIGFADALSELQPDLIVVLGDRFEIFAAAAAALVARIPVAHLHGGETTEGAFDEALRHSITKMSHLHFVAAEEYRQRVIQLGEQPDRVFLVGGLGIDNIKRLKLLDRTELEASLGFQARAARTCWSRFIRSRWRRRTAAEQMAELLAALAELQDTQPDFHHAECRYRGPRADRDGRTIRRTTTPMPVPTLPLANCAICHASRMSMAWWAILPAA